MGAGVFLAWIVCAASGLRRGLALIRSIRSRLLAQARTYFAHGFGLWWTSFGEDFVSSEQALALPYSRRARFWRRLNLRQVGFGAVCVRISRLRLNFIRLRSATVRFIRRVNANLAQIPLAFVSLVRVLFAPDAVCVRIAANFVKFYNKGQRCKI